MQRRWLPFLLASIAIIAAIGALALWTTPALFSSPLPTVAAVTDGDQEIALLLPATNATDWERFLQALWHINEARPLEIDAAGAFPEGTAAVPEIAWRVDASQAWLRVRWYKLTSATDVDYWVGQLARRQPAPLAVIGGDNSNRAEAIARSLQAHCGQLPSPPRFLITTATADKVASRNLMDIYPQRTFRFCFTNEQMARALADFLWNRSELHLLPDSGPVYILGWMDSSYSLDLAERFRQSLPRVALAPATDDRPNRDPFWYRTIPHSIGTFGRPNADERKVAGELLDELERRPDQRQALLVLPANSWPARRMLHALARAAPTMTGRFVVVNGDAIDFNTVYRDGNLTWPVQDLPFQLVFFCHRNPVDRKAGFRAGTAGDVVVQDLGATTDADTGTYDLLLYADLVAALTEAAFQGGRLLGDANAVDRNLRASRFDPAGNRLDGSGEHVVYLQPERGGERVQPKARLRVYGRTAAGWELQPPELRISYGDAAAPSGKEHAP